MWGRAVVVLSLLAAVACGASSPPPKEQPHALRPSVARRELPKGLAPFVPKHGVLVTGGGVKSAVFRVVIDTDLKTIYTGSSPAGSALEGKLGEERTRELTPRNEDQLMKLCADAWAEPAPATADARVEGYDEFLIIADGDEVFLLQGHGPITRPAAVKAIEALRAAAAL